MFGNRASFAGNWLASARLITQTVNVHLLGKATTVDTDRIAIDDVPGLFREPDMHASYEFVLPWDLPYRVLRSHADKPNARAISRVIEYLSARHGPVGLLHGHFSSTSRFFPMVEDQLGVPFVVTEHSTAKTRLSPDKRITRIGKSVARRVYSRAATVMPVSESLLEAIRALGLTGRFEVVPNPVDMDRLGRAERYQAGKFRIVCTARLARVKAIDVLLRALRRVVDAGIDACLTVNGSGPVAAELNDLTRSLDLEHRVEFLGHQTQESVFATLAGAHAFALTSIIENLPVAAIEALGTGLPVVATAVGGLPELVGREDGILVPNGDISATADALISVATGRRVFDGAGIAARARERYHLDIVAARLDSIYRAATSGANGLRPMQ
jgi:glycosyltransferase involved in cell wall biosynthesis